MPPKHAVQALLTNVFANKHRREVKAMNDRLALLEQLHGNICNLYQYQNQDQRRCTMDRKLPGYIEQSVSW